MFLDYFATGKLDIEVAKSVVAGIAEGCKLAGAALVGGETPRCRACIATANMTWRASPSGPSTATTSCPKLDKQRAGDIIIGLGSSGPHSNGYRWCAAWSSDRAWPGTPPRRSKMARTLAEALMAPTRIYVKSLLPLLQSGRVKGGAHITGGGLIENPPRAIAEGLAAEFDWNAWALPPVFEWMAKVGGVSEHEMRRTFNCGIGFIIIVAQADAEPVLAALLNAGEDAFICGQLVKA